MVRGMAIARNPQIIIDCPDPQALAQFYAALLDWKAKAPFAADNHPTDEHLMPIFFAYGAAGESPKAERAHASVDHGFFANDSYLFH